MPTALLLSQIDSQFNDMKLRQKIKIQSSFPYEKSTEPLVGLPGRRLADNNNYEKTPKVVLQLSGFTIHLVSLKNGDAQCLIGYKTNHIDDNYFTTTFRPCQK